MHKIILFFMLLFSLTPILRAEEKISNALSQNLQQPKQRVLPYAVDQAQESYTKTVHGGVQHVVVKSANNTQQIKLIQAHLLKLAEQLSKGDFSMTESIHGADMPGLTQLKAAEPDDIKFEYQALENGGQIHYSSEYAQYISALHEWFDAQAKAHGSADIPGHKQHHSSNSE